uniref:Uncharacterized protein n=1 Tax=Octopus bimaculoides TaxID=37653 RepID=A0A0L8GE57_OCTBM
MSPKQQKRFFFFYLTVSALTLEASEGKTFLLPFFVLNRWKTNTWCVFKRVEVSTL